MQARGETILLTDDFSVDNFDSSTFNNNNATTQSGTLATVNYNLLFPTGYWTAQHGNGNTMLLANDTNGTYGNVSLNNDFAANANAASQPLRVAFDIVEVSGFTDTSNWVQFNIGNAQNLAVGDGGVGLGIYFRQQGTADILSASSGLGSFSWSPNDRVTVTLSDTAGTGSAFDSAGSVATVQINSTILGPYTLSQQSTAYANFSAFNYGGVFGVGKFDNLSVSLVPEPGSLGLAAIGLAAAGSLLRRRRSR